MQAPFGKERIAHGGGGELVGFCPRHRCFGNSPAISVYHRQPDLLEPHILRSLGDIKVVSIHTSASSCFAIALDVDGNAWLFGRNTNSALGVPGVEYVSENAPKRVTPADVGARAGTKFVHAATGRAHSILVGSNGRVWTVGGNALGQVSVGLSLLAQGTHCRLLRSAPIPPVRKLPLLSSSVARLVPELTSSNTSSQHPPALPFPYFSPPAAEVGFT